MDSRKASLYREWKPLTDEHENQLNRAEETIELFRNGDAVDPLAVVGAYRSGKTQLLYHLFIECWDYEIPAFYVNDPGEMLSEFSASDATDLNAWIQRQLDDQLEAYAENVPDDVRWFPNVDTASKAAFVDRVSDDVEAEVDGPGQVRTAVFFDEVEQSYREFVRVMDKDDDNPLRKINDGLQDSLKVWSFGMISAFEFIGEADWGRLREIRVPPLDVPDVRELLEERRPDAVGLANSIWWLARGRTGLVIKLIDELPDADGPDLGGWLRGLAETSFRDTNLINNLWTELPRTQWEDAIDAILFCEDGLDDWQVRQNAGLTVATCRNVAFDVITDHYQFEKTDVHQDASSILDRNVERVFSGLAVSTADSALFPTFGLGDQTEADAFLALVSDMIVSFEPASDARSIAVAALDTTEGSFHTEWIERAAAVEQVDEPIATPAPRVVQAAFPPIAVNPERASDATTEEIRTGIDGGLRVDPGVRGLDTVTVRFCPTTEALRVELERLADEVDVTEPTVLVAPEDVAVPDARRSAVQTYLRHQLLRIETHQSSRFWTFVLHLHERLDEEGFSDPYAIDDETLATLLGDCEDREVRNTIETLYDQLRQVAIDQLTKLHDAYWDAYSLPDSNALLWEESRLDGELPFWSSGRFAESTIALSYLLVLGPEHESARDYAELHAALRDGVAEDLVRGGQNGFSYTSYLDNLFTQTGYSRAVVDERNHYRVDGQLAPSVMWTRDALVDLAARDDVSDVVDVLDDNAAGIEDIQESIIDVTNWSTPGAALIRALLVSGLTTGDDPEIDVVARLRSMKGEIERQLETLNECEESVESVRDRFTPPSRADVGRWIDIRTPLLEHYASNLRRLRDGTDDLITKAEADPSMGPLAYQYWFLLRAYLKDVASELEDLQERVEAVNVQTLEQAKDFFDKTHELVADGEFVTAAFDSRRELLEQLEEYGETAFDLQATLSELTAGMGDPGDGDTSPISQVDDIAELSVKMNAPEDPGELRIPEDDELFHELDDRMTQHRRHMLQMETDLRTIESEVSKLNEEFESAHSVMNALLTRDVEVNDD